MEFRKNSSNEGSGSTERHQAFTVCTLPNCTINPDVAPSESAPFQKGSKKIQLENNHQQSGPVSENQGGLSWWWVPLAIGGFIVAWDIYIKSQTKQSNQESSTPGQAFRTHNPDDVAFF
jgi:hypothetical protein